MSEQTQGEGLYVSDTLRATITYHRGRRWAVPLYRILECACSLTGHAGGCRMLQQGCGWPTARLYHWLHDLAHPLPSVEER